VDGFEEDLESPNDRDAGTYVPSVKLERPESCPRCGSTNTVDVTSDGGASFCADCTLPLSDLVVEVRKVKPQKKNTARGRGGGGHSQKKTIEPGVSATCPHCSTFYPNIEQAVKVSKTLADLRCGVYLCRTRKCNKTFVGPRLDGGDCELINSNSDTLVSTVSNVNEDEEMSFEFLCETDADGSPQASNELTDSIEVEPEPKPKSDHTFTRASKRSRRQSCKLIDYVDE
jgi:hypothetical protein